MLAYIYTITGESIGDATARLPYKRVQEYGISVSGLPEDKSLKHPSSYGRLTLRQILANKDNITVKGMAMYMWLVYLQSYSNVVSEQSSKYEKAPEAEYLCNTWFSLFG